MNVINGLNTRMLMDKHAITHYTICEKQLAHADEHIMHVYGRNIILACTECTMIFPTRSKFTVEDVSLLLIHTQDVSHHLAFI